jgi:DNA-binding transcriptional ArsR family regulator
MKRDMDLFREILKKLEDKEDIHSPIHPDIEGYSQEQISYHIELLSQEGLIDAMDMSDDSEYYWEAINLTNSGHDFIEAAKNETVWRKAKCKIISIGGGFTLKAMSGLMEKYLLELL